ncbi:MAG TPA: septation regulator SpoVG [Solirubrobacterales bacterium]|nr:septation regulator SpoVG [Solirubrobacterales bacterium]
MEITEVKVFPIQEEKLKAFVSIVFDQCFMINDIKIIQGRDGLFISMPSRKKKNGEFKDVAHPLNNETRRMIEEKVLAEYDAALRERGEPPADRGERGLRPSHDSHETLEEAHGIAAAPSEAGAAPAPPAESAGPAGMVAPEKSMEEVEEHHLSDSFWTV